MTENQRLLSIALERLEANEEIAILLGDGPQPAELKLGRTMQATLRAILVREIAASLPPMDPAPAVQQAEAVA